MPNWATLRSTGRHVTRRVVIKKKSRCVCAVPIFFRRQEQEERNIVEGRTFFEEGRNNAMVLSRDYISGFTNHDQSNQLCTTLDYLIGRHEGRTNQEGWTKKKVSIHYITMNLHDGSMRIALGERTSLCALREGEP